MSKKVVFLFTLLTLIACFLSYKLGSAPVALAKARPTGQRAEAETANPQTLPAPPAEWVLTDLAVNPTLATVTKAGASGVQHVADCISATGFETGSAGSWSHLELFDGDALIMEWGLAEPLIANGMGQISICGLNVVGTVGNSMTLEFDSSPAGGEESVNLVGHDAT